MRLALNLAGFESAWTFPLALGLEDWIASCPWAEVGGAQAVLVPESLTEYVRGHIERLVRAHDGGMTGLSVVNAVLDVPSQAIDVSVCRSLAIASDGPPRERRAMLGRALSGRCTALLLTDHSSGHPSALQEARGLADLVSKQPSPGGLAIVIIQPVGRSASRETVSMPPHEQHNLTLGRPTHGIVDVTSSGLASAWNPYVHLRLAWESAGNVERALRWGAMATSRVTALDDGALEVCLNDLALIEWNGLPEAGRQEWVTFVGALAAPHSGTGLRRRPPKPPRTQEGWPGTRAPSVPPWIARALLIENADRCGRTLLRSTLVCEPLAMELLGACLHLEAGEKARFWSEVTAMPPLDEARARFDDLLVGRQSSDRAWYPAGCPALPIDPWELAAFGEYFQLVRGGDGAARATIRRLRNAIAHGHYASWEMVRSWFEASQRLT